MADNELARALARRRAKAGESGDASSSQAGQQPPSDKARSPTSKPPSTVGMSIQERIAMMKKSAESSSTQPSITDVRSPSSMPSPPVLQAQRSAGSSTSSVSAAHSASSEAFKAMSSPVSEASPLLRTPSIEKVPSVAMENLTVSEGQGFSASPESTSGKKVSSGIHERLAKLGAVNVGAFMPGAGPPIKRTSYSEDSRESEEKSHNSPSYENYGPIAMPGMAKAGGIGLPGLASPNLPNSTDPAEAGQSSSTMSHTTMSRVTGPGKRRPVRKAPISGLADVGAVEPIATTPSEQSKPEEGSLFANTNEEPGIQMPPTQSTELKEATEPLLSHQQPQPTSSFADASDDDGWDDDRPLFATQTNQHPPTHISSQPVQVPSTLPYGQTTQESSLSSPTPAVSRPPPPPASIAASRLAGVTSGFRPPPPPPPRPAGSAQDSDDDDNDDSLFG